MDIKNKSFKIFKNFKLLKENRVNQKIKGIKDFLLYFIFIIICLNFSTNSYAEKLSNDKVVIRTIDIFPKIKKTEMPASMQVNNSNNVKVNNENLVKKNVKTHFLTNDELTIDMSKQNIFEQDEIRFNFEKYLIVKTKHQKEALNKKNKKK